VMDYREELVVDLRPEMMLHVVTEVDFAQKSRSIRLAPAVRTKGPRF
jgi:hypothetical protein